MADKILVSQTSHVSTDVITPFVLEETSTTRKVAYGKIVDNKRDLSAYVHFTITHERKSPKGVWELIESTNLAKLKAGEGVRLELSSSATKQLFEALKRCYAIGRDGLPQGNQSLVVGSADEVIVLHGKEKEYAQRLIESGYGPEFWDALVKSDFDLATKLSYAQIHECRKKELAEFRSAIGQDYDESYWQKFLSKTDWIFGYGLSYYCLSPVGQQILLGGKDLNNQKGQIVDFLAATEGDARYVVLVEIKKPSTKLLSNNEHRNRAYSISRELAGALAQIQGYIEALENNTSREFVEFELRNNLTSVRPKGIIVIGRTSDLDNEDQRRSFELFRNGLNQVEIITYDELLKRAEFIVGETDSLAPNVWVDDDALPF